MSQKTEQKMNDLIVRAYTAWLDHNYVAPDKGLPTAKKEDWIPFVNGISNDFAGYCFSVVSSLYLNEETTETT
jgi:hypothetical protein